MSGSQQIIQGDRGGAVNWNFTSSSIVGGGMNQRGTNARYSARNIFDIPEWQFIGDSYSGGGGYRGGALLMPHTREMDYDTRRMLSFYRNYIKPICNAKVDPVFSAGIDRDVYANGSDVITTDSLFSDFFENADGAGNSIDDFMHKTTQESVLQNCVFIVMDNFPVQEQPDTMAAVSDERKFPYVYTKSVGHIGFYKDYRPAYTCDRFGNLLTIYFHEKTVTIKVKDKTEQVQVYRYWDNQISMLTIYDEKTDSYVPYTAEGETTIRHGLGKLPVYPFVMQRNIGELYSSSEFYDMACLKRQDHCSPRPGFYKIERKAVSY